MAYCPERVLPGRILYELEHNDRVIGGINPESTRKAKGFYSLFVKGMLHETDAKTAEMCKLVENAYRDVNIAFANELSIICDGLGIDVWKLIELANRHPRVNILRPGPGVGGHCIAVDPWFIVHKSPATARLIRTAREINDQKPLWALDKVKVAVTDYLQQHPDNTASDITIACFGLAYKPDIDDLRESPALEITRLLATQHPGPVLAVEPNIKKCPKELKELLDKVRLVPPEAALKRAQIAALLVAHRAFSEMPMAAWENVHVVDVCGVFH